MVNVSQSNPADSAPGVIKETAGATYQLNAGGYMVYDLTTSASLTLSLPAAGSVQKGYREVIEAWIRQGATGYAVTLPTGVKWKAATAPTIDTTASVIYMLRFITVDGGTTWVGELVTGGSVS